MSRINDKYMQSIDQKGRLLLSKDVRAQLKVKKGDTLHLLPNLAAAPFLEIRTDAQFDSYRETILSQASSEEKRNFMRFVTLMHESVTVDGQSRIVVPERLRELCELDGAVAVINMHFFIEIWNEKHMEKKLPDMMKAFRRMNDQTY